MNKFTLYGNKEWIRSCKPTPLSLDRYLLYHMVTVVIVPYGFIVKLLKCFLYVLRGCQRTQIFSEKHALEYLIFIDCQTS